MISKYLPMFVYIVVLYLFYNNIKHCSSSTIEEKVVAYFHSSELDLFRGKWNQYKRAFDNAIATALKGEYANNIMNIYTAAQKKDLIISHGLITSDNSVQLIIKNMVLRATPRLSIASVNVALPSNVIRVEGAVETMFVETEYQIYRNQTSLRDQGDQDPYKQSPFSFQQVQDTGELALIVEGCVLIGTVVAMLAGGSISLGHSTIRLADCKFSVEISSGATGQPPVIAPYFSNEKGIELMQLLSKPIRESMMTRLQGTVLSYINTTDVLADSLNTYERNQRQIFRLTRDYTTELVSNMNKITIKKNRGTITLEKFKIAEYEKVNGENHLTVIELINVAVSGLETAYSANTGGPYKLKTPKISEAITFNSLQVRGNLLRENMSLYESSTFATELLDFTVSISIDIKDNNTRDTEVKFAPLGWRSLEFSIINLEVSKTDRGQAYSIITGYLSDRVPKKLVAYLSEIYDEATKITEHVGVYKNVRSDNRLIKSNENAAEDSENRLSDMGEQKELKKHRRNVVSGSENEEESFYKKKSDTRKT